MMVRVRTEPSTIIRCPDQDQSLARFLSIHTEGKSPCLSLRLPEEPTILCLFFTARLRHVRLFKSLFGIKGTKILEGEIGNDYGPPYR